MKLVIGLFALMLAVGVATLIIWRSVSEEPCAERPLAQALSPDERALAEAFEVSCAAAVATHVSLRPAEGAPPSRHDVFVAAGMTKVKLSWTSARELIVESPAEHVVLTEPTWRNVGIRLRLVR